MMVPCSDTHNRRKWVPKDPLTVNVADELKCKLDGVAPASRAQRKPQASQPPKQPPPRVPPTDYNDIVSLIAHKLAQPVV